MTTPRKVLIIGDASMFTSGLTAWLTCETTCQVSTICYDDEMLLQHTLIRTRPDVIVLSRAVPIEPALLLDLLMTSPELTNAQVVVVHPDDNTLEVYEKRQVAVTRGHDFITLVQGEMVATEA
jgi:hypothetical protein